MRLGLQTTLYVFDETNSDCRFPLRIKHSQKTIAIFMSPEGVT